MRGFSLVAVCSYSVNKHHRKCIKLAIFWYKKYKNFLRRGLCPSPGTTPSAPLALGLWCPFQMDWTPALVKSWIHPWESSQDHITVITLQIMTNMKVDVQPATHNSSWRPNGFCVACVMGTSRYLIDGARDVHPPSAPKTTYAHSFPFSQIQLVSGDRCIKLPRRGSGQSPGRKRIFTHFGLSKSIS